MKKKLMQSLMVSALVFAFSGWLSGAVTQADGNLVPNASFESAGSGGSKDAANWTEGTNHTRANNKFVSGNWSLKSTFVGDHTSTRTTATIAVLPNSTYTLSGYIWKSATNPGSGSCLDMND